jgi:hypothetical protein
LEDTYNYREKTPKLNLKDDVISYVPPLVMKDILDQKDVFNMAESLVQSRDIHTYVGCTHSVSRHRFRCEFDIETLPREDPEHIDKGVSKNPCYRKVSLVVTRGDGKLPFLEDPRASWAIYCGSSNKPFLGKPLL